MRLLIRNKKKLLLEKKTVAFRERNTKQLFSAKEIKKTVAWGNIKTEVLKGEIIKQSLS